MRAIFAFVLAVAVIPSTANADPRDSGNPFDRFDLRDRPVPLTDADLARRSHSSGAPLWLDNAVRQLGIEDGRAEVFRVPAEADWPPDAGLSGSVTAKGAQIRLRW